jgi:hypothetical protein
MEVHRVKRPAWEFTGQANPSAACSGGSRAGPPVRLRKNYLLRFLWRFFLSLFFRLCVAILWRFLFLPHGMTE